jgi:thiol-disulfide isomerase/thioredoxin
VTAAARPPRVRAPELPGAGADWLGGTPTTLASQRGRFVLLDFWTSCCANCLHVLDELRPLEARFGDILTVVGVHSAKFAHERDPRTVRAAMERYEVEHVVVNDPELHLWQQYAVKAWPTLALIDPQGYLVAQAAGEGQVSALAATIELLAAEHEAAGTLRRGVAPAVTASAAPSALRFPAKAIVLPAARTGRERDSVLVADAGHHSLLELATDGETVLARIGTGTRGRVDGPAEMARFAEPNGLTLLPPGLARYDVLVADTANHVLRGVRLEAADATGTPAAAEVVATIDLAAALAGTRTVTGPIPPMLSPWDVSWWPAIERVVIAAAGVHLLLAFDPRTGSTEVLAGTTVEGLRDGPAADGWMAQPSGLAVAPAGAAGAADRLWFVDSETSALRYLQDGELHTAVGAGLFEFGHVDGPAAQARLQHPLGVTVLADGSVAVLDTYNGAVRRYDPATGQVSTLAGGLAEPSGAVLAGGDLVVVESAAHRLVRLPALTAAQLRGAQVDGKQVDGKALRTARPPTPVAAGPVRLRVVFRPAPGRKLDERYGPSTRLSVSASPPSLLLDGAGDSAELARDLVLAEGDGVLHLTAQAASCDDAGGEHPACYLARQDWGVPVQVRAGGDTTELELVLLG